MEESTPYRIDRKSVTYNDLLSNLESKTGIQIVRKFPDIDTTLPRVKKRKTTKLFIEKITDFLETPIILYTNAHTPTEIIQRTKELVSSEEPENQQILKGVLRDNRVRGNKVTAIKNTINQLADTLLESKRAKDLAEGNKIKKIANVLWRSQVISIMDRNELNSMVGTVSRSELRQIMIERAKQIQDETDKPNLSEYDSLSPEQKLQVVKQRTLAAIMTLRILAGQKVEDAEIKMLENLTPKEV